MVHLLDRRDDDGPPHRARENSSQDRRKSWISRSETQCTAQRWRIGNLCHVGNSAGNGAGQHAAALSNNWKEDSG